MAKLSAVINTKDSSEFIADCLRSVQFADQIVVADMHSQDQTVQIAQNYTQDIFQVEDVGYVEPARNFALNQAQHEWILVIDSDERVPATLAKLIPQLIEQSDELSGYFIPRKNIIFERWIDCAGWWPDYQLRLFKKGTVTWSDKIHSVPQISGRFKRLPPNPAYSLIHLNYQTISQFINRMNRYTSVEAEFEGELSATEVSTQLIDSFKTELIKRLFAHQGIEIGAHGIGLSFLQAASQQITLLKRFQLAGFGADAAAKTDPQDVQSYRVSEDEQRQVVAGVNELAQDLKYWVADWQVEHDSGLKRLWWRIRRKFRF